MRNVITVCVAFIAIFISVARGDAPATQPAGPVASCDVFVAPFTALGGDSSLDWAGKAVSQNLLTDLARAKFRAVAADKPIPSTDEIRSAAKSAGAKYLIAGTYQSVDVQVRFNGQVIDTAAGNVLGGLSATGSPRDLFALEDALSAQAVKELTRLQNGAAGAPVAANNKPAAGPAAPLPPIVVQVVPAPAVGQVGAGSSYEGSALQAYVDANKTPSTDFNQQVQNAQDEQNYGADYGGPYYGFGYGYGYGGYGYGVVISGGYSGNGFNFGIGSGYGAVGGAAGGAVGGSGGHGHVGGGNSGVAGSSGHAGHDR